MLAYVGEVVGSLATSVRLRVTALGAGGGCTVGAAAVGKEYPGVPQATLATAAGEEEVELNTPAPLCAVTLT